MIAYRLFAVLIVLAVAVPAFAQQVLTRDPNTFNPAARVFTGPPPGSFPLTCRGGSVRALAVEHMGSQSRLVLGFHPGDKPAGQGIEPGHCAWADRAFRPGEAENLCQDVGHVIMTSVFYPGPRSYDFLMVQSAWSKDAPYLEKAMKAGETFTVFVESDGKNCMMVKGW